MKAIDIASPYPTVHLRTSGREAARLLTEHRRPALVVVDDHEHPVAVLPAATVLRFVLPGYIIDDPQLARVVDDDAVASICSVLDDKSVEQLLPRNRPGLVFARPEDNVLEVAALMVAQGAPLVAVVEGPGKHAPMVGAITAADVLQQLAPSA